MLTGDGRFRTVYGVDFSGGRLAGRSAWIARLEPARPDAPDDAPPWRLTALDPLERLSGTPHRDASLACLVRRIAASGGALWALGFPFGFPVEVMGGDGVPPCGWVGQFRFLRSWRDDAWGAGVDCLRRAKARGGPGHLRRLTDRETRAPHDPYHWRVIYQTFHGMRDVLRPFVGCRETAVLPFFYPRLPDARRVLVEACPASTLKRLGLPHQNYKQPTGTGVVPRSRRAVRRAILAGIAGRVSVGRGRRDTILSDPGGDALDALLAAVGALDAWTATDHAAVARHPRYTAEGRHYA